MVDIWKNLRARHLGLISHVRTCYIGVALYVLGFTILGAALQNHFSKAAVIIGWGIAQVAVLVTTVAVCEY